MASSLRDQLSARPRRHALRTELGNNERDRRSRVGGEDIMNLCVAARVADDR